MYVRVRDIDIYIKNVRVRVQEATLERGCQGGIKRTFPTYKHLLEYIRKQGDLQCRGT